MVTVKDIIENTKMSTKFSIHRWVWRGWLPEAKPIPGHKHGGKGWPDDVIPFINKVYRIRGALKTTVGKAYLIAQEGDLPMAAENPLENIIHRLERIERLLEKIS